MTDNHVIVLKKVKQIIADFRKSSDEFLGFSIGTTASSDLQRDAYVTPLEKSTEDTFLVL